MGRGSAGSGWKKEINEKMSGVDEGYQAIGLIPHNTHITRDRGIFIMEHYMTSEKIEAYLKELSNEERAEATIEKYRRALLSFAAFLCGAAVTPETIKNWKDDLRARKTTRRRRSTLIWQR